MTNVVTPGLAVMYNQSTGEHAPATFIGHSTRGKDSTTEELKLGAPRVAPIPHSPTKTALLRLLWLG